MSKKSTYNKTVAENINNDSYKSIISHKNIMSHKRYVYVTILVTTICGAIVPFAAQFILPFFFPYKKIAGAEVWNQYVSIILGVVATLMSIISLKLSFDNVNQSFETELKTQQLLHEIDLHLNDIEHNQGDYLTKNDIMSLLKNGYNIEKENDIESRWNMPKNTNKSESKDI